MERWASQPRRLRRPLPRLPERCTFGSEANGELEVVAAGVTAYAYSVCAPDKTPELNQDAFTLDVATDGLRLLAVVADGVSSSGHAGLWARTLCQEVAREASPFVHASCGELTALSAPTLRQANTLYHAALNIQQSPDSVGTELAYFSRAQVLQAPGSATLVCCAVDAVHMQVTSYGLGDTMLFRLPTLGNIELIAGAPTASGKAPQQVQASALETGEARISAGPGGHLTTTHYVAGDCFLLATDALAEYIYAGLSLDDLEDNAEVRARAVGAALHQGPEAISALIAAKRLEGAYATDDTTAIWIDTELAL